MATDSTNLPQGEANTDASTDMAGSELDLAGVQLAQVEASQTVNLPKGNQVVLIPVQPGSIIQLPTDPRRLPGYCSKTASVPRPSPRPTWA